MRNITNREERLVHPTRFDPEEAAEVINPEGTSPIVLVCEHATNTIPPRFRGLGLGREAANSHAAWDPGANLVAQAMAGILDAPLVRSRVSRLVYDCNRPPDSPSAVPATSEIYKVPGNQDLSEDDRMGRARDYYFPFRDLVSRTLAARGPSAVLVTIHTFTPVFFGKLRSVEIGILHDEDSRLADALLQIASGYDTRRNCPYGPQDGVTHTLRVHGLANGFLNVMIEVRNDLVANTRQSGIIAEKLADWIRRALAMLQENGMREFQA